MLGILIGGNIAFFILFCIFLIVILKNNNTIKKIAIWIEDAIEVMAHIERIDVISFKFKPYQVQVDFEIDGNEYHKISSPGNIITGYNKIFVKYHNKKIKILYSQKYDEVLILKQEKDKES